MKKEYLTTLLATVVKRPSTKTPRSGPETRPTAVTPNWRMPSNSEAATAIPMLANPIMLATMRDIRTLNDADETLSLFLKGIADISKQQFAHLAGVGHAIKVGQWPKDVLVYDCRGRVECGGNRATKKWYRLSYC